MRHSNGDTSAAVECDLALANGCELLERGLGELVGQIIAVRASVATVSSSAAVSGGNEGIETSFLSAATYVAGTLNDVSDRLQRIDALLGELELSR